MANNLTGPGRKKKQKAPLNEQSEPSGDILPSFLTLFEVQGRCIVLVHL